MGADLADMQLASKFNKEIQFLLHLIDINSKYGWVVPLKDKKNSTAANKFQEILNDSGCKSNEIWLDKGSEFCNRPFKSWLQDKDIEVHSKHNEG